MTQDPIDAVLNALRDTPPPAGLEDRLLQSLSTQPTIRVPHSYAVLSRMSGIAYRWWNEAMAHLVWIGCTATAFAIIFLTLHTHRNPNPNPVVSTEAHNNPVISTEAQRSGEIPALPAAHTASISPTTKPTRNSTTRNSKLNNPPVATAPLATPYEQAALEDTLAPSHPAPPLPLTQQERLLLRILHHSSYTELAELDPTVRAVRDAHDTAAFQDFFRPPTPIPQVPATENPTPQPGEKQ